MKRNLLLTCLSIFCFSAAFSQITHKDYGEGLVIDVNANYAMDIDDDGIDDFYFNKYQDELGLSPIFFIGCFPSPQASPFTSFGSRNLQIFAEGEVIKIDDFNMFDYIDDDDERGSIVSSTGEFAEGWANLEDQYIGFAVFSPNAANEVYNGWIRMAADVENNALIVYEYAFENSTLALGDAYIEAGDIGSVAVQNLDEVLNQVVISPNPVRDIMKLNFDYQGDDQLQISILDNTGRLITSQTANGSSSYSFDTSNWAAGLYSVNFSTKDGVRSEKIFVSK